MKYLLAISIGPVQEFIAAARKTADLQAGSDLLQEIARAVALEVQTQKGELIFPSLPNNTIGGCANKVLAILEGDDPKNVADKAFHKALCTLMEKWVALQKQLDPSAQNVIELELAKEQLENFLEFYAAWVPLLSEKEYPEKRKQVERLLAGRKALRDFRQPCSARGHWKSSLDPSRDNIIKLKGETIPPQTQRTLNLKPREYLDAISFLKRHLALQSSTPPTVEMAVRSLLRVVEQNDPDLLERIREFLEKIQKLDQNKKASTIGDVLFEERFKREWEDVLTNSQDADKIRECASLLRKRFLEQANGKELLPYYAILVADGDRMGAFIDSMKTPTKHQDLSRELANFAQKAPDIICEHDGHCVYTGGDDVLAFLPIHQAIPCAAKLADAFQSALAPLHSKNQPFGTLSCGVAIVHYMEPLQISLQRARQAEKLAKTCRNALCVALHTRGGAPTEVVESWGDNTLQVWENWRQLIQAMEGGLARGLPYELEKLARFWEGAAVPQKRFSNRLLGEANRVLNRKEGHPTSKQILGNRLNNLLAPPPTNSEPLLRLALQMVIARFLSRVPIPN